MIVKEDLVTWFQNLESYKRIDIMCTLLNLCLPFELRFLGTCLEELGRRDAQDLRGAELRVNNPLEFVNDVGSFQAGQPTETKIRRKMALYLALMRASNRNGVNELFKTLDRWGDRDFTKFSDGDPLQELLLVYTMATNHPVFSFEQRLKCGEVYSKILSCKTHLNPQQSPVTTSPVITTPLTSTTFSVQHQATSPPPPFTTATFQQQNAQQIINPQTQPIPNPMLMAYPPSATMTTMLTTADPSTSIAVESLPPHMAVPPTLMQIPTDFSSPPPWQQLRYQPPVVYSMVPMDSQFPPQAISPHLSQPSSPTQSRTGSPSRVQVSTQPRNNRPHRNARPPAETTPPPQQHHQVSQGSGTVYIGNDMIKSFEDINMEGAISQLYSLNLRNGYKRPTAASNTLPRQHNKQSTSWSANNPQNYTMHMVDQKKLTTTAASDSGGSSTGEASPPLDAPSGGALHGNANQSQSSGSLRNKQPLHLSRLNGGRDEVVVASGNNNNNIDFNNGSVALVTSTSSGNLPQLLIGGQMHNFPMYRLQQQRQQQPPQQFQPNGDLLYSFTPPFTPTGQAPVVLTSRSSPSAVPTPYPTNKMVQSCFNCGSTSHTGLNCSEASMEDVTRNAVYKLDYTVNTPTLQFVVPSAMAMSHQPANNNEPSDTSITFIDLTQDTTSSSSSSSTSSIHGAK